MKNAVRNVALAICATALWHPRPACAQALDEPFRADVEKLMQVTGAAQLGAQMVSTITAQVLEGMKRSQPSLPERAVAIVREVLDAELAKAFSGSQSMMPDIVAVYAKQFTQDDVRGMVAFYESPLGRKMIQAMPAVLQDTVAIGQRWAQNEMPRIGSILQERLRAEGFIK